MLHTLTTFRNDTFWRVTLATGKQITEGQISFDFLRGTRSIDWHLDIASTNDCKQIKAIALCTPEEEVTLHVSGTPPEPYCVFQFKQGTKLLLRKGNIVNAHIIGRVDDKRTGDCTAIIWDALEKKVYTHTTTIYHFSAWRQGVADIGPINYQAMGVRL